MPKNPFVSFAVGFLVVLGGYWLVGLVLGYGLDVFSVLLAVGLSAIATSSSYYGHRAKESANRDRNQSGS
jgi:hypothetical protein